MQVTNAAQQAIAAMTGPERRAARLAAGKTQMNVANECGVQLDTIRKWELGVLPSEQNSERYVASLELEET